MKRALCLAPPVALLTVTLAAPSGAPRILYPRDRTVESGPVTIIVAASVAAPSLSATLDGKPLRLRRLVFDRDWVTPGAIESLGQQIAERETTALWVARVTVPGRHVVAIGAARVAFALGVRPPKGWQAGLAHPPMPSRKSALGCDDCHQMPAGRLGPARTPDACGSCHPETAVQLAHKHVAQPLARCGMCHDPHGASYPRLLVAPKEKLCIRCHAGGHSKG